MCKSHFIIITALNQRHGTFPPAPSISAVCAWYWPCSPLLSQQVCSAVPAQETPADYFWAFPFPATSKAPSLGKVRLCCRGFRQQSWSLEAADLATNSNKNVNPLSFGLGGMISSSISVSFQLRLPLESRVVFFWGAYVSLGCLVEVKGQEAGWESLEASLH